MRKIAQIKQNSDDWHLWRSKGIGASESNIIMGLSKFKTPLELWDQKVNGAREEDKTGSFITEKGHRLEAKARPLFEMEMGHDFPDVLAVHAKYDWLRASLDGWCEELGQPWECKFVGQEDFEKVANGQVLEHYYPQLQHQMLVTGASVNNLTVIADDKERKGEKFPFKTCNLFVHFDEEYVRKELFPKLVEFWENVKNKTKPQISKDDFLDMSKDKELSKLLTKYKNLKQKEAELEKVKKEIFKLCKHNKVKCKSITITQSKSDDSTKPDYEKYCKDQEVDMKDYMKVVKGRATKRINLPKD